MLIRSSCLLHFIVMTFQYMSWQEDPNTIPIVLSFPGISQFNLFFKSSTHNLFNASQRMIFMLKKCNDFTFSWFCNSYLTWEKLFLTLNSLLFPRRNTFILFWYNISKFSVPRPIFEYLTPHWRQFGINHVEISNIINNHTFHSVLPYLLFDCTQQSFLYAIRSPFVCCKVCYSILNYTVTGHLTIPAEVADLRRGSDKTECFANIVYPVHVFSEIFLVFRHFFLDKISVRWAFIDCTKNSVEIFFLAFGAYILCSWCTF